MVDSMNLNNSKILSYFLQNWWEMHSVSCSFKNLCLKLWFCRPVNHSHPFLHTWCHPIVSIHVLFSLFRPLTSCPQITVSKILLHSGLVPLFERIAGFDWKSPRNWYWSLTCQWFQIYNDDFLSKFLLKCFHWLKVDSPINPLSNLSY